MASRSEGIKWAARLQAALGDGYSVWYDECESCMTSIYYKNHLVKRVPNEEINGGLDVGSFVLDYSTRCAIDEERI